MKIDSMLQISHVLLDAKCKKCFYWQRLSVKFFDSISETVAYAINRKRTIIVQIRTIVLIGVLLKSLVILISPRNVIIKSNNVVSNIINGRDIDYYYYYYYYYY